MSKDGYTVAELLGTFQHPKHPDSNDWTLRLFRAADSLVFATNADPIWEGDPSFDLLVEEYGIDMESALKD